LIRERKSITSVTFTQRLDIVSGMLDFGSLYRQYAPDVYRFALYLSGDASMAEDLTAETFVRVWTARNVRVATVRAYLFAIVRNLYRQRLRAQRREAPLESELADATPDAEFSASKNEQLRWLSRQLLVLPEIDRTALLMRFQTEMSYEEIASTLELSIVSVKVRVHRAKLKLARMWAEENSGSNT
jgi:RNA polymerase sigma-70 factor (ECF subfamily)